LSLFLFFVQVWKKNFSHFLFFNYQLQGFFF
jgi:hypothetical protein